MMRARNAQAMVLTAKTRPAPLTVLAAVAAALIASLAACTAIEQESRKGSPGANDETVNESASANAMFERFYETAAARSPMYMTYLGRKEGKDSWDDLSDAYAQETHALKKAQLTELNTLQVDKLDASASLSYELMAQALHDDIADFRWRWHNYPLNQMFGLHSDAPSLLINQHTIADLDDARAYIARLQRMPAFFGQLITGVQRRQELGIVPPRFVFAHVIRDSRNIISGYPYAGDKDNALLADFKGKLQTLQQNDPAALDDTSKAALIADAEKAMLNAVKPAYETLIAAMLELEKSATTAAGVWKFPDGEAFYNNALARTTTTSMTAQEIHDVGLREVARIHAEMRVIKDKVGFKGDLKAFMRDMRSNEKYRYPASDAGRHAYITDAAALIDTMQTRLDELFITKPKADLKVKAVEAYREQSAGKAFYQRPSEDGSRPATYYANLYDMASMPSYQMEALAYHEGIPGHHMQIAIAQELKDMPRFRKHGGYTAYIEGWGLYAEYLPKEIGMYKDPYSDFGRLAMELCRACRLVVDTGIHAKRWTRQQGIDYYLDNTPNAKLDGIKMVERHIVMPSQATAYKVGMLKILELREAARERLGDAFDIREFHEVVLQDGALPLNVLQRKVEAWAYAKAKAAL